jgi:hypothetical protein
MINLIYFDFGEKSIYNIALRSCDIEFNLVTCGGEYFIERRI